MNKTLLTTLLLFMIVGFIYYRSSQTGTSGQHQVLPAQDFPSPQQNASGGTVGEPLAPPTKTTGCAAANGLPDSGCTPGAVFPGATKEQICISGYSKSVRNVPIATKQQVYSAYGIASRQTGEYEMDHLISLELGGSNDVANLWPELASPKPGFHEKDAVENYLHAQICNGAMSIQEAQHQIATNWLEVYKTVPDIKQYIYNGN